ncbi:hypothetical protein SAY86_013412 [Trapa natans]|uniref:Uncharacterized protein n=1 Tax=Trapa natans TaxID=22666 RepID=A0AAN7LTM4_TRANT|nr:hypothetical protein SAY86_013412 [Trapa natans]
MLVFMTFTHALTTPNSLSSPSTLLCPSISTILSFLLPLRTSLLTNYYSQFKFEELSKPPTWFRFSRLILLAQLVHHQGRDFSFSVYLVWYLGSCSSELILFVGFLFLSFSLVDQVRSSSS